MKVSRIAIVGGGLGRTGDGGRAGRISASKRMFSRARRALARSAPASISARRRSKALRAIGLGDKLAAVANVAPGIFTRDMQTGERARISRPTHCARHATARRYYTFHRADLMDALASGLDPARLHLDHRLAAIEESADGRRAHLRQRRDVRQPTSSIAADGVHSVVRRALYGDDNPTYTGQMVWRALLKGSDVPAEVLEPSGHIQWLGAGCHFFAYYLRGREVVNIVTQEDTDQMGRGRLVDRRRSRRDARELSQSRAAARRRCLSIVTECSKWGLFTRPLTDNWGRGRIQLIGDAAHAMLPNAGQGAAQAFEDAYILARWLAATRAIRPRRRKISAASAFRAFMAFSIVHPQSSGRNTITLRKSGIRNARK